MLAVAPARGAVAPGPADTCTGARKASFRKAFLDATYVAGARVASLGGAATLF